MPLEPTLQAALLAAVPHLRGFAYSLCRSMDRADDLVQETLTRGIAHIDTFTPRTNLTAWLTTIMRNTFLNECRKRGRTVEDPTGVFAATLTTQPEQESHAQFGELQAALQKLPFDQRIAIILVGAQGLSYEEAADICGCATGTIKSRANRARAKLAAMMAIERADDLGPDASVQAALGGNSLRWAA